MRKLVLSFIVLTTGLIGCKNTTKDTALIDPVVNTLYGKVKGVANPSASVTSFKGIQFAAPPIGEFRWQPPQPPVSWEGIRDASQFGASAVQVKQGSRLPWTEEFMVQNDISEDCLFLNIWTPAKTAKDKLSVLVYIHGGALIEGSGAVDVYDGEELAKKGIIVVTINYRLGVLGYLAHAQLTAESPNKVSGNYGLLDQIEALKWVKENIEAFGGDASRITIAGQSAGAGSVNGILISPQAAGLFHGAITESGTVRYNDRGRMQLLADAEKQGEQFLASREAKTIEELRQLPFEELIKKVEGEPDTRYGRVIDNYYQPADYTTVYAEGKQNDVPFINGYNADETRYIGDTIQSLGEFYPFANDEEKKAAIKLAGQQQVMLNSHLWMEHRASTAKTNAYEYFFTQAIPWPDTRSLGLFIRVKFLMFSIT